MAPVGALGPRSKLNRVRLCLEEEAAARALPSGAIDTYDRRERQHRPKPVECGGPEAADRLNELVENRLVVLTTDPTQDRRLR